MTTKLLYDLKEAQEILSIGRSLLLKLVYAGELESVKVGGRRLIPASALGDFVYKLRAGD